ncbi:MAG: histidinol dehydrogenase [Calditrichaeota bacterium]|nr:MAG: histidinol dehydrogenase [Calditrichota bacterium]MBL1205620.1 histidinol dehydrogenase [Calditrichota bacterium]NOG45448.1 histidinol dehydrogenase [Calditrichota bacterium]
MKKIRYPAKENWANILKRPSQDFEPLQKKIQPILDAVRKEGDEAVKRFTQEFDQVNLKNLTVSQNEIEQATSQIDQSLKEAIALAIKNITAFHKSQLVEEKKVETSSGVFCWRKNLPIEKVGLYIPGGTAPLFSTVLMLGIPAVLAGCKEIILCSPPNQMGKIHPAVLYVASQIGISKIYKAGGAQAIAAMAFGTKSIPKVDKIFGPGNQFVTIAKQMLANSEVAIDMPAGPSEVLVLADKNANADFVAADLLSQAEHGIDSQVIFITDDEPFLGKVNQEIFKQLANLPRKEIAEKSLENSLLILVDNLDTGMKLSNFYAPEHLILMIENYKKYESKIVNAGSVFLGPYSPEAAGDYASGTNHVLPTNGFAKNYSGVSMDSFMKKISFQELSESGLKNIGPAIETMAEAEELFAHKNAVSVRLKNYDY